MSLKDKIKTNLLDAQKKADRGLVAILKLLWSEIGYLTVDGKDSDEGVLAMLKQEMRKRKDSIEIYEKAGDKERVESEKYELKVIKAYLPEDVGENKVKEVVKEVAKETGLSGGQLIGAVMKKLAGKAPHQTVQGELVARIVGEISS